MESGFPGLTPIDEITVRIPDGMTEEAFLKAIEALAQPNPKGEKYPKCETCSHQDATDNHCRFFSSTCLTAVFNGERPPRYDPK